MDFVQPQHTSHDSFDRRDKTRGIRPIHQAFHESDWLLGKMNRKARSRT